MGNKIQRIYVGGKLVRPKWEPGANTVAYRPLNSTTTVNDQSGNGYTLTKSSGSFTTVGGVSCFYNGGGSTGYLYITSAPLIPSGGADRTISIWARITSLASGDNRTILRYGPGNGYGKKIELYNNASAYGGECSVSVSGNVINGRAVSLNTWMLHTIVVSNGLLSYYVNGAYQGNTSGQTINTSAVSSSTPFILMRSTTSSSTNQARGYISEVIIENAARSVGDITSYFNNTKGNYGLS